ncbi:hypothetical protein CYLTODRAFT_109701 [Cylindrobasidium torrendii FP15055 ss-10]|uniref:Uncharacterized protein n=1 Tax=Cylindrobasidium torrendii FP15055 ss-10 TaxID=1314674 RepID=A0A0D7BN30_9AGAR|nr:hypothetical protein CYLTODRAFT_109701 [Cylindrobasidium torrendii FP15055 ss-10]
MPHFPSDLKNALVPSRISSLTLDDNILSDVHALALYTSSGLTQIACLDQPLDEIPKVMYTKRFLYLLMKCIWPCEHISLDVLLALAVDSSLYHAIEPSFPPSEPFGVCAVGLVTSPLVVPVDPSEAHGSSEMQSIEHDFVEEIQVDPSVLENETHEQEVASFQGSNYWIDEEGSGDEDEDWVLRAESEDNNKPKALPSHVHLLMQPLDDRVVDFPLLCFAEPSTVLHVMSSALLHRRALGIQEPMLCIITDIYTSTLQLAIGWTEGPRYEASVEIHLAYGALQISPPLGHSTGIFNVHAPADAFRLAICLMAFRQKAISVVPIAHDGLLTGLASPSSILHWRLDQAERDVANPTNRIQTWANSVYQ